MNGSHVVEGNARSKRMGKGDVYQVAICASKLAENVVEEWSNDLKGGGHGA